MRGWSTHLLWETTLAQAARLRGATVSFATCGGRLPICDVANVHSAPPMPCLSCSEYAEESLRAVGFQPSRFRDLIDVKVETAAARQRVAGLRTIADCEAFIDGDLALGRLVRISVAWFLARGTLPDTPQVLETYRRFLVSGQIAHRGFQRLLERESPDRVVLLNGTFFFEAVLTELARQRGIPITSYERGFAVDSIVVTPGRPAAELLVDNIAWTEAAARPLSDIENSLLDEVLDQRTRGEQLADNFWHDRIDDVARIRRELGLQPGRHLAVLFTNILWDSAVQGHDIAYPNMAEWVVDTIRGFAVRADCDLLVRLHPAEIRLANHPTVEKMADIIAGRCGQLPANVRVIPPESIVSSYSLMSMADVGLVYTSTVGLEMAVRGVPVVVAAGTHYRDRGFTDDVEDPTSYWQAVDSNLESTGLNDRRRERARRYAALFLLRFMQPLDLVHEVSRGRPELRYSKVGDLAPGQSQVLDRVSAGIMHGAPVLTPVDELR